MTDEELPLPEYDHLPVGSLQHRIRSLGERELRTLLDYERAHNDRVQVEEMIRNRLDELAGGAEPSPGSQDTTPKETSETSHGSPVTPSGSPQPMHPPPEGVAGQQGKPKANRPRK